jgi:hypothetical protein
MQLRKIDFAVAAVGAVTAAIFSALVLAVLTPLRDSHSVAVVLGSIFVYLPFCLIGEFAAGFPAFLAMLKMNLIRWWIWLPLSIALGAALYLLVGGADSDDRTSLVVMQLVSLISVASFRLVWSISKAWH